VPVILGEHVSAEDGTGAVHTAPGHGQEDFAVGRSTTYGYWSRAQSGRRQRRLPARHARIVDTAAHLEGERAIIDAAARTRHLLAHRRASSHSYPHCWRHKTPVAFRATPQWFISMEQAGLRATRWRDRSAATCAGSRAGARSASPA
jgi:isoleucyl-tRNA synthetase